MEEPNAWSDSESAITVVSQSNKPRQTILPRSGLLGPPNRRVYTDYQELLSLEAEAKKLRLRWPRKEQPLLVDPQISKPLEPTDALQNELWDSSLGNGVAAYDSSSAPQPDLAAQESAGAKGSVILAVDQRMNMFFGSGLTMKSVAAAKAAALIAWHTLARGHRIGAMLFNDSKIVQLRPHCSRLRVLLILNSLLSQNHELSPTAGLHSNLAMLNEALRKAARLARGNCLVILISDGSGQDDETQRLFDRIVSRNNDLVFACVYDPRQQGRRAASSLSGDNSNDESRMDRCASHRFETSYGAADRSHRVGTQPLLRAAGMIPISNRRRVTEQLRHGLREIFSQPTPGNGLSEPTIPTIELTQPPGPRNECRA
jgi:hypothetical protein